MANFETDHRGYTIVYTDGACFNNGQPYAQAGIGVYFNEGNHFNVSRPVHGRATNNTAEIQAATEAARQAFFAGRYKLLIITDSDFLIKSYNNYIPQWEVNNWLTYDGHEVINKHDFIQMLQAFGQLHHVEFKHVNSHQGIHGNERADQLARQGAMYYPIQQPYYY